MLRVATAFVLIVIAISQHAPAQPLASLTDTELSKEAQNP